MNQQDNTKGPQRPGPVRYLHRAALWGERLADAVLRPRGNRGPHIIEPYAGYASQTHLILRGRVLSKRRVHEGAAHQSRLVNLRQMLALFLTREVAGVKVMAGGCSTLTDDEGYFTLKLPSGDEQPGWRDIDVRLAGQDDCVSCPVLIPREDAQFIIISDIDDTVLKTGAHSLPRNLWVSLTGNAQTRRVFPDAVQLLNELSDKGRNPVFYVSSSPWNFHNFLARVFARNGVVRGPLFLRDLGLSPTKFITEGHGAHKGQAIDTILSARPDLSAILIGDTGQKDALIYREAAKRHPGRICAVLLRMAANDRARLLEDLEPIRAAGVPVVAALRALERPEGV